MFVSLANWSLSPIANICFFKKDGDLAGFVFIDNSSWVNKEVEIPKDSFHAGFTTVVSHKDRSSITLVKAKSKIADGAVTESKIADGAVTVGKVVYERFDYEKIGRELFSLGGFITKEGIFRTSDKYLCTDFLFIPVIKQIGLRACQVGNQYLAVVAFYDKDKIFLSALSSVGGNPIGKL